MNDLFLPTVGMKISELMDKERLQIQCPVYRLKRSLRPKDCDEGDPKCDVCIAANTDHMAIRDYVGVVITRADHDYHIIRTENGVFKIEHNGYYKGRVTFEKK